MKNENGITRFNLGLIISLSLTLVAFEWKSYSNYFSDTPIEREDVFPIEDDWIPVLIKKIQQPTPLPQPDNTKIIVVDEIEKQFAEPEKKHVIVPEKAKIIEIAFIEPKLPPEKIPVYNAEEMAEFNGGLDALYKYLYDNIDYSSICRDAGVEGTVYVNFIIEKNGSVSNINISRGIAQCKILNKEVINAIKNMPAWSPAKQNGRKVRLVMTLPVKFTLRD